LATLGVLGSVEIPDGLKEPAENPVGLKLGGGREEVLGSRARLENLIAR
jgi:hypothetical protein